MPQIVIDNSTFVVYYINELQIANGKCEFEPDLKTIAIDKWEDMLMVTLKDIANACSVSISTVSRALNNPGDVNGETVQRIRQTAQEMGYYPNAAARTLKTNRSGNIGILYENQMHHEYFSLVIDALRVSAAENGYDLTFLTSLPFGGMSYLEHAQYRGLDGVIIVQADFHRPEVARLASSSFPCVAIDHEYDHCGCVISNNQESMEELVHFAYERGHRKIAFIHGEADGNVTQYRLTGFYKACAEHGLRVAAEYVRPARYHEPEDTLVEMGKLLALKDRPSCIFCPDDYCCLGAITAIEKAGLFIPNDVSIVGYDGIRLADALRPRLTTYRQDVKEIGKNTVQLLMETIEQPQQPPKHICVRGSIQIGETL